MRTIQEFLGHADSKTTLIYAHYSPSGREVEIVNGAFGSSGESVVESVVQSVVQIEANSDQVKPTDSAQ